jgi:hypothetical protein
MEQQDESTHLIGNSGHLIYDNVELMRKFECIARMHLTEYDMTWHEYGG